MKYVQYILFCCLFLLISAPTSVNAGASVLAYDYNVVQSLEKTPTQKSKIKEWAKQKRLAFKPKFRFKTNRFDIIDEEYSGIYMIIGVIAYVLALVLLGIVLKITLIWAVWLAIGLFSIFVCMLLFILLILWGTEKNPIKGRGEKILGAIFGGFFLILSFYLGLIFSVFLFIVGLILGFVWVWIVALSLLLIILLTGAYLWY
jgi:hypothetical protein